MTSNDQLKILLLCLQILNIKFLLNLNHDEYMNKPSYF